MPDHDARAARERRYGAQEAAKFLGIHRSTLHLAVRRTLLVPDATTPGGHMRFRQETLDAFRRRLHREPATSEGEGATPVSILAEVAQAVARGGDADLVCHLAVSRLCHATLGVDMCSVSLRAASTRDRLSLRVLAQCGFPAGFFADYERMRPQMEFASTTVLRTLEPEVCADTASELLLHTGTARIAGQAGIRSYIALPLIFAGEALGVLVVASRRARRLGTRDLPFLQGIAATLATALHLAPPRADPATEALRMGDTAPVVARALPLRQRLPEPIADARHARQTALEAHAASARLHTQFLHLLGAVRVCAFGFGAEWDLTTDDLHLGELACRAYARDDLIAEEWSEDGERFTAQALSLRVSREGRVVVGAVWRGQRARGEAEHALLVAFAGAHLLAR